MAADVTLGTPPPPAPPAPSTITHVHESNAPSMYEVRDNRGGPPGSPVVVAIGLLSVRQSSQVKHKHFHSTTAFAAAGHS